MVLVPELFAFSSSFIYALSTSLKNTSNFLNVISAKTSELEDSFY
jgi:hypothetical protein